MLALKEGDVVRLLSKPDGYDSQNYPLTVGKNYKILYLDGSNVVTTCDVPGEQASHCRLRVAFINRGGNTI